MKLPPLSPQAATIIAGALIALAILFIGRWEIHAADKLTLRLDARRNG